MFLLTKRNVARLVITSLCAILASSLVPEQWSRLRLILPSLSPLLALCGAVATFSFTLFTFLGLILLVLPLFAGRFFCWRLCPMGFLAESMGRVNPKNKGVAFRLPFIGKWLALLIIGSAAVGYPVVLWSDPLSIFNGFFSVWRKPLTLLSTATGSGFVVVLALSALFPNIWCHRLCPLGGLQEMLTNLGREARKKKGPVSLNPETALERVEMRRRTLLGTAVGTLTALLYQAFAEPARLRSVARHTKTLRCEHGAGCGRGRGQGGGRGKGRGHGQELAEVATVPYIRPPGAVNEGFNALCARCGNCMAACPYGLILPDLGSSGVDGILTPVLLFQSRNSEQEEFCFQECAACAEVCPTGALRPLTREGKQQRAIGLAHICKSKCLAWEKQEYCMVCQEFCPYQAIELEESRGVMCPVVESDKCRGCGACESQCPALPIAIIISGRANQIELAARSPYLDA